jgi:hypothetical protein
VHDDYDNHNNYHIHDNNYDYVDYKHYVRNYYDDNIPFLDQLDEHDNIDDPARMPDAWKLQPLRRSDAHRSGQRNNKMGQ